MLVNILITATCELRLLKTEKFWNLLIDTKINIKCCALLSAVFIQLGTQLLKKQISKTQ